VPSPATPEAIAAAADRLRGSRMFGRVDVHTRAGDRPGDVVLVFDVRENQPHLRFGLGYEDYSSWYLIPIQLNADNLTGHGEGLSFGARFGYRVAGLDLSLRRPAARDARDFWELRARGEGVDRVYFFDSTETLHHIERGGIDLRAGRHLSSTFGLEAWLASEKTRVDSNASVYTDRASLNRHRGDEVPFPTLPPQVQRDVRDRAQGRLGLALVYDRRRGSGLETHGVWGRLSGEGAFSRLGDYGSWQADARAYVPVSPGLQLAARVRGEAVSPGAPFYDRYYAGGLYTVRGYPSQSLSPPQGNLNLGCGSFELRHAWVGPASNPRVTAIAFLDGAAGWSASAPSPRDVAWGMGFGFRFRVPWLGQVGVDAARPLSVSPVREGFHLNSSLGWSF
jgi:outer membrane protein assembly factor BamA